MIEDFILVNSNMTDLDLLTNMYHQLRCDEEIDDIKTFDELYNLMKSFLESDHYSVYILKNNEIIAGYALVETQKKPVYLKHLFILKEFRGKGLGKDIINRLLTIYQTNHIDIEVMTWNTKALAFYNKLGFKERYKGMRLYKETKEKL